jgi:hypothetical protein
MPITILPVDYVTLFCGWNTPRCSGARKWNLGPSLTTLGTGVSAQKKPVVARIKYPNLNPKMRCCALPTIMKFLPSAPKPEPRAIRSNQTDSLQSSRCYLSRSKSALLTFALVYFGASSRLTSAARCGGTGAARASYWSFRVRPIDVARSTYLARERFALFGGAQARWRIQ